MEKQRAIEHYGSAPALSRALGISRQAVYQWGDIVPEKQAMRLERITGGTLPYDEDCYRCKNGAKNTEAV